MEFTAVQYDAFIAAFITLFVIIDPIGIAPIFAGLTQGTTRKHQNKMAIKGSLIGFLILAFFAIVGRPFLDGLGISMDGLRVAGGIMLFIIALQMVMAKRNDRKAEVAEEINEHFEDISVFPMALPMLAGPGAIATIMLLMANVEGDFIAQTAIIAAMVLVFCITMITFMTAAPLMRLLGSTVNAVLTRVLGIILAALAAQYVLDGLKGTFIA